MERAIWKGSISFGLVQIPVEVHPAIHASHGIRMTMLDETDLSPIEYERVNRRTGRKVAWKDVVKGYEYVKGAIEEAERELPPPGRIVDLVSLLKESLKAPKKVGPSDGARAAETNRGQPRRGTRKSKPRKAARRTA
jgi:non-homologous end joining protein Ku